MTLKHDLRAYKQRWKAVEEIQTAERRSASLELRWQQLNTAYGIAKGLGLLQPDLSELEVFERWAKLKEKAASQPPKA
jgi:N-acetylglutamate synthase/N-acetylornithine aminotransferase